MTLELPFRLPGAVVAFLLAAEDRLLAGVERPREVVGPGLFFRLGWSSSSESSEFFDSSVSDDAEEGEDEEDR